MQERGEKFELLEDEIPVEVQVIGIGDTRIVGIQGEIFVEFGMTIQYRAPFDKTFVIELANGCLPGYACTARAYAQGGYETGASLVNRKNRRTACRGSLSNCFISNVVCHEVR